MNKSFHIYLLFFLPLFLIGQESLDFQLDYQVSKVYPPLSISKPDLAHIKIVDDLNKYYKAEWVEKYVSVTVAAQNKGQKRSATSKDHVLTEEQLAIIRNADAATQIEVDVRYLPKNNLKVNEEKDIQFSLVVDPDKEAKFPGGETALHAYLEKAAKTRIPNSSFKQHHLAAVEFTIDETGEVVDAEIYDTSMYGDAVNQERDKILLEAVCNMPKWTPAQYADGLRVKTNYVLTAGDHYSCVINFFNVKNNLLLE